MSNPCPKCNEKEKSSSVTRPDFLQPSFSTSPKTISVRWKPLFPRNTKPDASLKWEMGVIEK